MGPCLHMETLTLPVAITIRPLHQCLLLVVSRHLQISFVCSLGLSYFESCCELHVLKYFWYVRHYCSVYQTYF